MRRGRAHASMGFPEVIVELQRTVNPNQFPEFKLMTLTSLIRVHLPSSVLVHEPTSEGAKLLISELLIKNDRKWFWRSPCSLHSPPPSRSRRKDVRKVTEWINSLDRKVELELSGVYRSYDTWVRYLSAINQLGMPWKSKKASNTLPKDVETSYASKNKGSSGNCQ